MIIFWKLLQTFPQTFLYWFRYYDVSWYHHFPNQYKNSITYHKAITTNRLSLNKPSGSIYHFVIKKWSKYILQNKTNWLDFIMLLHKGGAEKNIVSKQTFITAIRRIIQNYRSFSFIYCCLFFNNYHVLLATRLFFLLNVYEGMWFNAWMVFVFDMLWIKSQSILCIL